jgi:hypothetical protein
MKGKVPQPLFSYGFLNDLSRFPICTDLDAIAKFEADEKARLKAINANPEACHFKIPYDSVEKIAGELNDQKRFYGPIYESTINFLKAIKDSGLSQ